MLLKTITVDIIRNTGYNTWYDFLGNLDNATRLKSNGETDYLVFNPNKEEIQISLPLGKDRIGELAKLELEEILKEAGIKTIADLYTKIKGTSSDVGKNYKLEYTWFNPKIKSVEFKIVQIPLLVLKELSKSSNPDFGVYSLI